MMMEADVGVVEGAMSQGMGAVSRIWKRQSKVSLLDPQEAMEPGQHLDLSPLRPIFRLLTSVNRGRYIGVVLSYYICGNLL